MTEESVKIKNQKWKTLEHNGVSFPQPYRKQGITISIRGEQIFLNDEQEEMIYAWAKKKDTHYIQDPIFQRNFLSDFIKTLPSKYSNIKNIDEIDFSNAYKFVDEEKVRKEKEKERLKNLSREEKKRISQMKKDEKERLKKIYGIAYLDGEEVEVANWLVEPPGLFMGRGLHPLRGKWKPRVSESDVILNLGETAAVPEGAWKKIVHDHSSTWLATWIERLTGKRKYVWLHDSADLRQNKDKEKYDKAKKLEKHFVRIENEIIKKMRNAKEINQKKIATVCYLIIKLAMRVGDEKDPEEADTVGASTLRVEHIKFPRIENKQFIEFNFLGKDSVPWQKTIEINSPDTVALYENLISLMKNKSPESQVFDNVNSAKVNTFLRNIDPKNVPGLTAKVFRTYLATKVVKESLVNNNYNVDKNSSEYLKLYVTKLANLNAAITCNHKKGIDPKNPASKKALDKLQDSLNKKEATIKQIKADILEKKWKTESQKKKLEDKLEKISLQLKLQKETKDYNLGTSLRNYIDPRVMKGWMDYMDIDWKKMYTTTLQRKFKWVEKTNSTFF